MIYYELMILDVEEYCDEYGDDPWVSIAASYDKDELIGIAKQYEKYIPINSDDLYGIKRPFYGYEFHIMERSIDFDTIHQKALNKVMNDIYHKIKRRGA